MTAMLVGIGKDQLAAEWPRVAPLLAPALGREPGETTLEDVRKGVDSRDMQLWGWLDGEGALVGAAVSEIREGDSKRVAAVFVGGAGAPRAEWLPGLAGIEAWARAKGCHEIEIRGREGWRRVLPGYRLKQIVLARTL